MASKQTLNPCSLIAALNSSTHPSLVMMICLAPSFFNTQACSSLLTILRRGTPKVWQRLFNILPKLEPAAVWMSPTFPGVLLNMSSIPTTVRGFTTPEAAEVRVTSWSISNALLGSVTENYPHVPELVLQKLTRFPTQLWTFSPLAQTTLPVPSIPITAGSGNCPQPPVDIALSDGLTVEPSILMSSYPSLSSGFGKSSYKYLPPNSLMIRAL